MLDVAIAFVIFNRPGPTEQSFAAVRSARPKRLFLIGDAARRDRPGEDVRVRQCRQIARQVDWDCDVTEYFAEQNLGCGRRISSGITAALGLVDELIVLEDDCVADPSFFGYCRELLKRYRHDDRVMAISGNNFQRGRRRGDGSYYFSKYSHCWGWATWRRAWCHFDLSMSHWPTLRSRGWLTTACPRRDERRYWTTMFDRVVSGRTDTWAFPWLFACWQRRGLTALPNVNLVTNIGFGADATHTNQSTSPPVPGRSSLDTIAHPRLVTANEDADRFTFEHIYAARSNRSIRRLLPKWLKSSSPRAA